MTCESSARYYQISKAKTTQSCIQRVYPSQSLLLFQVNLPTIFTHRDAHLVLNHRFACGLAYFNPFSFHYITYFSFQPLTWWLCFIQKNRLICTTFTFVASNNTCSGLRRTFKYKRCLMWSYHGISGYIKYENFKS